MEAPRPVHPAKSKINWIRNIVLWLVAVTVAKIAAGIVDELLLQAWIGYHGGVVDAGNGSSYLFHDVLRHGVVGFFYLLFAMSMCPKPKRTGLIVFCIFGFLASALFYGDTRKTDSRFVSHFISVNVGIGIAALLCFGVFFRNRQPTPETITGDRQR